MQVEWYGQSAFRLAGDEATVFIDPFGDTFGLVSRGIEFNYPAIEGVSADVVLLTHEHADHNGLDAIGGDPEVVRLATWPRKPTKIGDVMSIASEHDAAAGTQRGPNAIFRFELDGLTVCHFGDFGQAALRPEQREAIGPVDLLFLPVGGGPTIGAEQAADIAGELAPRWLVPMHYRTHRVGFLEPVDDFLERMDGVQRLDAPSFDTAGLAPGVVVPAAP
jgi:L-ascorbate metabolism protein UlaG (beta-lactamase superfamily)